MRLNKLTIQNYRSLRKIEISPKDFSVLIGRNSSGKSNFADALEFLSITYADGLEHAVARKGGYENIAHRKERRSRSAIAFFVEVEADIRESDIGSTFGRRPSSSPEDELYRWTFRHFFEFKTSGEGIRSDFRISSERVEVIKNPCEASSSKSKYQWLNLVRNERGKISIEGDVDSSLARAILFEPRFWAGGDTSVDFQLPLSELLFVMPFFRPRVVGRFTSWIKDFAVFQLSPDVSRHPGIPTPNPHLSTRGENLPAVVDWLQRKKQKEWRSVLQAMRDIVPELTDITVGYLHTKALGLYFSEKGIGRPWTAEEVSDGTIRALSMLVACFDPRNTALVVEEPENSLHPWIIKEIVGHLRSLSAKKLVMITSHSPVVLNMLKPDEVWVIYKEDGETKIQPLVEFDSELVTDWSAGKYRLFDYLESGYVAEAVP